MVALEPSGELLELLLALLRVQLQASTVSRLTADLLTPTVSAISPITRPYFRVLTPAIRTSIIRSATAPGLRIAAYRVVFRS